MVENNSGPPTPSSEMLFSSFDSQYSDDSAGNAFNRSTQERYEKQFQQTHHILDIEPPHNEELSARFRRSFAYVTFRERTPKMLLELMRCLQHDDHERRLMEEYGNYARYDLRRIIWSLNLLREDIIQNKPFSLFHGQEADTADWNDFLEHLPEEHNQWFSAVWLHAECYLYRRISTIFKRTPTLSNFDYFGQQKICATRNIICVMSSVLKGTCSLERSQENFKLLLKMSLWSNRCDLSITKELPDELIVERIARYEDDLLVDQSAEVWRLLLQLGEEETPLIVDIVLDNAGYELFCDLLLAEYLLKTGLARKVRFHVKAIPWFISDVTEQDFQWMLHFFRTHEMAEMAAFGKRLHMLMREKRMELCSVSYFWTSPYDCRYMRERLPCLYVHFSQAALAIFKGDLNYRKLLGDMCRDSTEPFVNCLRGFLPTSICALRAIKSDIYCGLPRCIVGWLTEDSPGWMITGQKAIIQLAEKPRP